MLFIVLFFYLFALCTLLTFVFGLWYFVARLRLFLFYVFFFFFLFFFFLFFFSSRRRHTRWNCNWSSDVCSSDLSRGGIRLPACCPGRPAGARGIPEAPGTGPFRSARTARRRLPFPASRRRPGRCAGTSRNPRSEERRVGKECRSGWSPSH